MGDAVANPVGRTKRPFIQISPEDANRMGDGTIGRSYLPERGLHFSQPLHHSGSWAAEVEPHESLPPEECAVRE